MYISLLINNNIYTDTEIRPMESHELRGRTKVLGRKTKRMWSIVAE